MMLRKTAQKELTRSLSFMAEWAKNMKDLTETNPVKREDSICFMVLPKDIH